MYKMIDNGYYGHDRPCNDFYNVERCIFSGIRKPFIDLICDTCDNKFAIQKKYTKIDGTLLEVS